MCQVSRSVNGLFIYNSNFKSKAIIKKSYCIQDLDLLVIALLLNIDNCKFDIHLIQHAHLTCSTLLQLFRPSRGD